MKVFQYVSPDARNSSGGGMSSTKLGISVQQHGDDLNANIYASSRTRLLHSSFSKESLSDGKGLRLNLISSIGPMENDIQSVIAINSSANSKDIVIAADSRGNVQVNTFASSSISKDNGAHASGAAGSEASASDKISSQSRNLLSSSMVKTDHIDDGWCGLAAKKTTSTDLEFVSSHSFARESIAYTISSDGDAKQIRTYKHVRNPTSTKMLPRDMNISNSSEIFICSEWNTLSLWDSRSQDPLIRRIINPLGPSPLFAIDYSTNTGGSPVSIAITGEAQILSFIDPRTWSVGHSRKTCLKHDAVGLKLTERYCYLAGLDNEIAIMDLEPRESASKRQQVPAHEHVSSRILENHSLYRGPSKWVGLDLIGEHSDSPYVVGFGEGGELTVINFDATKGLVSKGDQMNDVEE